MKRQTLPCRAMTVCIREKGAEADSLSASSSASAISPPTWTFSNDSSREVGQRAQCTIDFEVPYSLGPGVFLYYKLTN
jgi:hypothetical protein